MVTPPVSPLEAKYTTPGVWRKWTSFDPSPENSLPPQLIETCFVPARVVATSTAAKRFAKLLVVASTKTIFALGAIAWAHSISSAASCAQPQLARGLLPLAYTTWKTVFAGDRGSVEVSCGRPNCAEKTLKSLSAVG